MSDEHDETRESETRESDMPPEDEDAPEEPSVTRREAAISAVAVTLATAVVIDFAFAPERAGQASMLIAIGLLYAIFTAVTLARLHKRGDLRRIFRPGIGDLTLGAATAGLLYGGARIVAHAIAEPGSPRVGWLFRLYLQLGDPAANGRELVSGVAFGLAVLEEITWRGLVMRSLELSWGSRWALLVTALLFTLSHTPTLTQLSDPLAGPNPLVILAAIGCNLVWGLVYLRTKRLVPSIFAHAFFTWAVIEFPIWRP